MGQRWTRVTRRASESTLSKIINGVVVLDGGRLLFVVVEAIRRKRIEPMQEGMVHLIGLGLLLRLFARLFFHLSGQSAQGFFDESRCTHAGGDMIAKGTLA